MPAAPSVVTSARSTDPGAGPPREPPAQAPGPVHKPSGPLAMNRRILMTPFHNVALMSPATSAADVDRHTAIFGDAVATPARLTRLEVGVERPLESVRLRDRVEQPAVLPLGRRFGVDPRDRTIRLLGEVPRLGASPCAR